MNGGGNQAPIYFRSVELENVRCFAERQRLGFLDEHGKPAQWVLILGDNGIGKTTLLQCLAWMRPVILPEPEDLPEERDRLIQPALNDEENQIWNSLIRIGGKVSVKLKATLSVGRGLGNGDAGPTNATVKTKAEMKGENGRLQSAKPWNEPLPEKLWEALRPGLPLFAYGATRRSGPLKVEGEMRPDALASLFRSSTELYDAEDILLKLDHRALKNEDPQDRKRLVRVKKILAIILPDIEHEENINIRGPTLFESTNAPGGVRFQTPYGLVPLSALSLGYQTTLTWVLDLALRLFEHYPESPAPLSEPGIVLIDNIDLHLHPRWQRRVMENLSKCFPAIQFIATAHSPLIVQAAEGAVIAVLRKQNDQVVIETPLESVNAWRADQILASDLFDIPTRSRNFEKLTRERNELLEKLDRSKAEEDRLDELVLKLDSLPTAEHHEDRDAMDLIRRVAASLKEDGPDRS